MLNPLEHGWEQQDLSYVFKWFEGDQLPRLVSDFIKDVSGNSIILYTILHLNCSLEKFINFFFTDDNEDDEQNDRDDEHYQYENDSDDDTDEL